MYTYICKYVYIVLQTDMHIKNVIYGEKIIERTLLVTRSIFTVSVCTSLQHELGRTRHICNCSIYTYTIMLCITQCCIYTYAYKSQRSHTVAKNITVCITHAFLNTVVEVNFKKSSYYTREDNATLMIELILNRPSSKQIEIFLQVIDTTTTGLYLHMIV